MTTLTILHQQAEQLNNKLSALINSVDYDEVMGASANKYSSLKHNDKALNICAELLRTLNESIISNSGVNDRIRKQASVLGNQVFKLHADLEQRKEFIEKFGEDTSQKINLEDLIYKTKILQEYAKKAEQLLPAKVELASRASVRFVKPGDPASAPVVPPRGQALDIKRAVSMPTIERKSSARMSRLFKPKVVDDPTEKKPEPPNTPKMDKKK